MLSPPSSLPQMPMIRSTSENCPQHLLTMNERSVNNEVSTIHDPILDETLALARSTRTQFNVTTSAQSSITSFSVQYKTSPPEKKRQQQSVRYLPSLSQLARALLSPAPVRRGTDLGSVIPGGESSPRGLPCLFPRQKEEIFLKLGGFLCILTTHRSLKAIPVSGWKN